ncbi:MAG: phospholipase D-like domain-containing protein, partial [Thiotrichaceae bacterium]
MKILILSFTLFLTACGGGFSAEDNTASPGNNNGSIQLFFSKPEATDASQFINGPEKNLITAIDNALISVDMAMFELSLRNVTDSLIRAHQRGVQVRVLTDTSHLFWDRFVDLKNAGITVRGDQRSAYMHNKFTIVDGNQVWTGSMNMTYFGAYRNRENLIRLNSFQTAVNYTEEFSQLWTGIHNQANSADNYFSINSTPVDIHFSPDDNFRETRLLPLLRGAKQSVHIMAFAFTSQDIADALVALDQRGVDVKVVVDSGQSGQSSSQYDDLQALSLNIRRDGQSFRLHHKVIIVDGRYVVTGSYNFSENAESRNDENSIVLDDR